MCKNLQILIDTNQCLIGNAEDDLKLKIFFLDLKFNLYYIFLSTICKYGIVKVAKGFAKFNHRCTRLKIQVGGQLRVLPKCFGRCITDKITKGCPLLWFFFAFLFTTCFLKILPYPLHGLMNAIHKIFFSSKFYFQC